MGEIAKQTSLIGEFTALACQQHCFAYPMACDGHYASAPCACAWRSASKRYHQCRKCYLVCLDRSVKAKDGTVVDDALQQFRGGLPLTKLSLAQALEADFPLFIPTRTADFPLPGGLLPLRWAAADAKQLRRERVAAPASLSPKFSSAASTRAFLRVGPACRLLMVLNGQDRLLESFWAMDDRIGKFQQLAASSFELSTGATFSVMHLTVEGTLVPQLHNLAMQRRHHRVAQELQQAGLVSVPNLYWFDEREQRTWAEWLRHHPLVGWVSRDLSRTRSGAALWEKLTGLVQLLDRAGRPFHVFLVGPGPATAASTVRFLAEHGHTSTVITADPILQGISGKLYDSGLKASSVPGRSKLRHDLVLANIERFETHLLDAVATSAAARRASRNMELALAA